MRNRAQLRRHPRRDITWNVEAILVASAVSRIAYVPPEILPERPYVARPRVYVAEDVIDVEPEMLALPSPQERT
jgi:hypothetical protein